MIRERKRRGFTLVELMVVLAILVLLVAMVGPRLLGTQKKADVKATVQQIANLEACLQHYAIEMRTFPSTEEGLKALLEKPASSTGETGLTATSTWGGPYIEADALPLDPWGNPYQYEFPPTKGKRTDFPNIWSLGPDGEDSTEDDIKNWTGDGTGEEGGTMGDDMMREPAPPPAPTL